MEISLTQKKAVEAPLTKALKILKEQLSDHLPSLYFQYYIVKNTKF
jgi:hypothetical protein